MYEETKVVGAYSPRATRTEKDGELIRRGGEMWELGGETMT